ncbi:zinc ribbon domain-containing protein [Shimwellia blattae]|uniref:Primosomal protein N' (Replication factor Y)-superfamily II helicase n=1 Tax=Shimwellia blattae (strain ATCC 29907 / DSM 4481 / JCM 1650 / NBRC 105725 / CDC 9005-74) TaxID=630626 RepID=I2B6K6_SHIBC|nr:zinc ribbon domain-containing protein [Shimwellia blattae]AFJ46160.1 hypothetical protein EBL_c10500 [Shimwellia blattae DSM 4481 = NBRC 105725]GAB81198.1 hypothetical protein YfgJ [Shimwellia blattae DSM 4481 = NBRC 105725]VDY63629.1 Protein of uncharacterised function (DUF1407) [Shimwellia blattae]VEC21694.1 Protein of uncharacterised function (DUF1407) [Shimwellia blattae]
MDILCPACQAHLEQQGLQGHCPSCQHDYALLPCCPECHQPLEVLKACGAVDYFCQHGHGLISRKRVEFVPQPSC